MEIVILSHSNLAEGLMHAVKMIAGNSNQIHSIGLFDLQDPDEWGKKIDDLFHKLTGKNIIVFVDLFMGTPCNQLMRRLFGHNIKAYTGANLGMVLEAYVRAISGCDSFDEYKDILDVGKTSIIDLNEYSLTFTSNTNESDF